jgi:hypothetical protein
MRIHDRASTGIIGVAGLTTNQGAPALDAGPGLVGWDQVNRTKVDLRI